MQEFYLYDENRVSLPILKGFPWEYSKEFGLPNTVKYHAYFGKYPLLFQAIKSGYYELVISDYLTRKTGKITCRANTTCLELHFILSGKVFYNLKDLGWAELEEGRHNLIALSSVKNEVYFKRSPVSTWDVHFSKKRFLELIKNYPKLAPLSTAVEQSGYQSLFINPEETTPFMLHLIVQINEALREGNANYKATTDIIEQLIILVLENKKIKTKYKYVFNDIEKIHRAHRLIGQYIEEKDILAGKLKETSLKPDKFREGFRMLFGALPGEYYRIQKLEKAKAILIGGRATTIEAVALLCGYSSAAHLAKIFQQHFGMTISAILKRHNRN